MRGIDGRVAFDHVKRLAVEISHPVEPIPNRRSILPEFGRRREIRHIDDESVPLPVPVRPSHHLIDQDFSLFHIDLTASIPVLIDDQDCVFVLEYLKRIRQISDPGYTGKKTLHLRIKARPVLAILIPFGQRPRLIRDLSTFDHAQARRNGADCAQHESLPRRGSSTLGL